MKTLTTIAVCIALTGCVIPTKQDARKMSTLSICYNITTTNSPDAMLVYMDEIRYRNADCNQYAEQVRSLRIADAERERRQANALQGLAASQALMNAGRPAFNCRSSTFGGVTTTNCN